jgi:hypothetical protein
VQWLQGLVHEHFLFWSPGKTSRLPCVWKEIVVASCMVHLVASMAVQLICGGGLVSRMSFSAELRFLGMFVRPGFIEEVVYFWDRPL